MAKTRFISSIILILILAFLLFQVVGLLGRQSQGFSITYIITYIILGGTAILFVAIFGIFIPEEGNELIEVVALNDFKGDDDFRLPKEIMLIAAAVFTVMIAFTAATGMVNWQPIPSPFVLDSSVRSPLAAGHAQAVALLGITQAEEQWFTSAQPAFFEDLTFNFFLPLILTGLLLALPLAFNIELNRFSFTTAALIACLISSGITGAYTTGLIPTFAGAHSDVYTDTPSFYAAAGYSFVASFINVQLGLPVTMLAHFLNNWFVVAGMLVAFSIGTAVQSGLLMMIRRKAERWLA